jgi:hypothetical protein
MAFSPEGTVRRDRRVALDELYGSIEQLRERLGGPRRLAEASAGSGWPDHGIYLFFEDGETREDGITPRVARVGTHALTERSRTTLWNRLSQHRGSIGGANPGAGNHRGSVFRLHVGNALIARDSWTEAAATWGRGSSAAREARDREVELERAVSRLIGAMPVLWLGVPDRHLRGAMERDLIALLSNAGRMPVDPPSKQWLGRFADREAIRRSGLWNVNYIDDGPISVGLEAFQRMVARVAGS